MKKMFVRLFVLIFTLFFAQPMFSQALRIFSNESVVVPFKGAMDCRFGYEGLFWGMDVFDLKKVEGYPFVYTKSSNSAGYTYSGRYGYNQRYDDGSVYEKYYAHGDVEKTEFFCYKELPFCVVDELKVKNPSLSLLHERYGDFSDENVAPKVKDKSLSAVYTNFDFTNSGRRSLWIEIKKNGKAKVIVYDSVLAFCCDTLDDMKSGALAVNKWHVVGWTDGKDRVYNYIIFTKNENDDMFVFQYKKTPDSPATSSLKAGFSPKKGSAGGLYEIKTNDGVIEKKFGSFSVPLKPLGKNYNVSSSGSAREMLQLVLDNERVTVRKNDAIMNFSFFGFEKAISDWRITLDELDFAIANEEF